MGAEDNDLSSYGSRPGTFKRSRGDDARPPEVAASTCIVAFDLHAHARQGALFCPARCLHAINDGQRGTPANTYFV